MSNEIKLSICPCCEGQGEIIKQGHREYAPTFAVRCKKCRLTTGQYDSEEEAAGVWNIRKPLDIMKEAIIKASEELDEIINYPHAILSCAQFFPELQKIQDELRGILEDERT